MAYTGLTYSGAANRGTDRNITIRRNDTGAIIQLGGRLSSFEASDKDTVEEIDGIDNGGRVDHVYHAGGQTGSVSISRFNGDFEDFAKAYNANFYAGASSIYCTMYVSTNNSWDTTQNVDTYTQVVLGQLKSGPWENKKNPKVSFQFHAQERL